MRGEGRRLLGRSNFIASASPAIKSARRVSGRRSSVSTERYIRFPPFEEATPATLPKWRGPDGSVEGGPGTPALAALPHPQEKSFDHSSTWSLQTPGRAHEVAAIASRAVHEVLLVLWLRLPKGLFRVDLRHDRAGPAT